MAGRQREAQEELGRHPGGQGPAPEGRGGGVSRRRRRLATRAASAVAGLGLVLGLLASIALPGRSAPPKDGPNATGHGRPGATRNGPVDPSSDGASSADHTPAGPPRGEREEAARSDVGTAAAGEPPARSRGPRTWEVVAGQSAFDRPPGAPAAVVHAPAGVGPRPWVVVFLHGWNGCARALVRTGSVPCVPGDGESAIPGWGLGEVHDAAGLDTVLVVPQLAWRARETGAGRFRRPGFGAAFLDRVLGESLGASLDELPGVSLLAHSAGYETAEALLTEGPAARVRDLVLFDAFYGRARSFEAWVVGDPARRLLSYYASDGSPWVNGRRLHRRLRRRLGRDAVGWRRRAPVAPTDLVDHRYLLARAPDRHADVPAARMVEALRALAGVPGTERFPRMTSRGSRDAGGDPAQGEPAGAAAGD